MTVKATRNTGLAADDVFYFGNAVGETGNNTRRVIGWTPGRRGRRGRARQQDGLRATAVANVYDFNRDRRVTASDELAVRQNFHWGANALPLISPPASDPPVGGPPATQIAAVASGTQKPVVSAKCVLPSTQQAAVVAKPIAVIH